MRCRPLACLIATCLLILTGCSGEDPGNSDTGIVNVCVSSTDVAELVKAVGGEHVSVTAFVKGEDDPHRVITTPDMIQAMAKADLLAVIGLGLEDAWLPTMLDQAGNADIKPDGKGYLELSTNIRTIVGPEGRGVPGSFHPEDNPHYLPDPVEGIKAANAIADKLAELRPALGSHFQKNAEAFSQSIIIALIGQDLAQAEAIDASNIEALAIAIETDQLAAFPKLKENPALLGGWLGKLKPFTDQPVVGDHDLWPYFARRYGIRMLGYLEPKPGVPPTIPHLQSVIADMKEADVQIILSVQYFDERHARFIAEATDTIVAPMSSQPGGRPGTNTYLDFINYNAQQLHQALSAEAKP